MGISWDFTIIHGGFEGCFYDILSFFEAFLKVLEDV